MPRRPPPSPLRLIEGPLPGRGKAKHTLPSVPRPVHVPSDVSRAIGPAAPEPRIVTGAPLDTVYEGTYAYSTENVTSGLRRPRRRSTERGLALSSLANSSGRGFGVGVAIYSGMGVSGGSSMSLSPLTTPSPDHSPSPQPMRGPWDHSRAVSLPIDVGLVLALPKPVAISP